ncbi:MAG: hypothetical protein IPG60_11610 [Bacteroidetes bacterium]|nr:hypothetical protein [Bacteroidota bacterium]
MYYLFFYLRISALSAGLFLFYLCERNFLPLIALIYADVLFIFISEYLRYLRDCFYSTYVKEISSR